MSRSYEKINYSIRPSKSIERKMFCEAFRKLSEFGDITKYRYVGFGSTYFSDFTLMHKALGLKNMISIEEEISDAERFEFNVPFSCITMKYGNSNDELPALPWDVRTILWLDYDRSINTSVLTDIKHFFTSAIPGSIILITLNASIYGVETGREVEEEKRLALLEDIIGKTKIPLGITGKDLHGWKTSKVFRRIMINEIEEIINARNGSQSPDNKLSFKQLFYFQYKDGAKMLTLGGIFIDEGQEETFKRCAFDKLEFFRDGDTPYEIKVPNLTLREIKYLEKFLPNSLDKSKPFLPEADKKKYSRVYRYFPLFAETEL